MVTVIFKYIRSLFGFFLRMLYPLKRLLCRRRKLSTSEPLELTSIKTGDSIQVPLAFGGLHQNEPEPEIEMEAWDSWGTASHEQAAQAPPNYNYAAQSQTQGSGNGHLISKAHDSRKPGTTHGNFHHRKVEAEPEPEPDINFFEDMTPSVKKQKKYLIRKNEAFPPDSSSNISSRLAMTSNLPVHTAELDTWDDHENAWASEEASEDLTWQAVEAIREKKRKERQERQFEQQRRKQMREEMRGMKGSSHIATKIS